MTTIPTVLVTAATGTVGRLLVPLLRERGATVRAHDRTQPTAPQLDGVDAVFLACPNVPEQVEFECAVIDAAAVAGVGRIVKLSARGAAVGSPVAFWDWHARIELHLAESGLPAVNLRPGFSMANLLGQLETVRNVGMLPLPAGAARVAMIDPADVAAAAAVALLDLPGIDLPGIDLPGIDPTHGRAFELTGPAALGFDEVAAALASVAGQPVRFVDVPPEQAVPAMVAGGVPQFAAEQIGRVFAALRAGAQTVVTDDVRRLTGRAPGSLRGFLETIGHPENPSHVEVLSA